jgi:deoxyribodipyrimidine photo-lyase
MNYTIFIFRRDLRIRDNNGLKYAMSKCKNVIPIYIFTPEQISESNKFRSDNAVQFMVESLKDLDRELNLVNSRMHYFYGDNIEVLSDICKKIKITNIVFNVDYTKYSRTRDGKIMKFCKTNYIECLSCEDYLLSKIGQFNKNSGKGDSYLVFTPFKNNAMNQKSIISKPANYAIKELSSIKLSPLEVNLESINYVHNEDISVNGGRNLATKQLLNALKSQSKYNDNRDQLSIDTTQLSAYIKFGCLSIREVYWTFKIKLGPNSTLLSQLFWREFYYYIAYYHPDVLSANRKNFRDTFDGIKWTNNKVHFAAWCEGKTGFPIVDAGMRQLNKTGYMHNRARLITANFLNRILNIDWRWGEMYYASKLTDYDPAVNNGNWQWIASTGVDTSQYFQRVFSPINQSKKYDTDAKYITYWIPELKDVKPSHIHDWGANFSDVYIKPIISYSYGRTRSLAAYKLAASKN